MHHLRTSLSGATHFDLVMCKPRLGRLSETLIQTKTAGEMEMMISLCNVLMYLQLQLEHAVSYISV